MMIENGLCSFIFKAKITYNVSRLFNSRKSKIKKLRKYYINRRNVRWTIKKID